jgi:WD40 repeat protein
MRGKQPTNDKYEPRSPPSGVSPRWTASLAPARIIGLAGAERGRQLAVLTKDTVQFLDVDDDTESERYPLAALPKARPHCLAWSSQESILAIGDAEGGVDLFTLSPTMGWRRERRLVGHHSTVNDLGLSPNGRMLASASADQSVRLWQTKTGTLLSTLQGHRDWVRSVTWSRDQQSLASGGDDHTIFLWDPGSALPRRRLVGHAHSVSSVRFSPDGTVLASASWDKTIRLWDVGSGRTLRVLEGHTHRVETTLFLADGALLASRSADGCVRLWRTSSGAALAAFDTADGGEVSATNGMAALDDSSIVLTVGREATGVSLYEIDRKTLLARSTSRRSILCMSAKVVLLGDSGVGKSALGLRLSQGHFRHQISTHGQQFWLLPCGGTAGTQREIVLWDFAGQPDYRLIHALFLDDADLALVVFDPTERNDPLRGVEYWLKALEQASGIGQPTSARRRCPVVLVAARADRGDLTMTGEEIAAFCRDRGVEGGFVATSAVSGRGMEVLRNRITSQVRWDKLPTTSTPVTFKRIKEHVLGVKSTQPRSIVRGEAELVSSILKTPALSQLRHEEVETAIGHLAKHGYVRPLRTSTGRRVLLLAPELLNNVAASMVLDARRNARGLGALEERRVLDGSHPFAETRKLRPPEREILTDAATTLFLEHNLCFREHLDNQSMLVFPELINQRRPLLDAADLVERMSYLVSGPVENVYSALVVLLGYTNDFVRTAQWQDQAQYEYRTGEICGFRYICNGLGEMELVLQFAASVGNNVQRTFQALVERFLEGRELTVRRYPPLDCAICGERQERSAVIRRTRHGHDHIYCAACAARIPLASYGTELALNPSERRAVELDRNVAGFRTHFEASLVKLHALLRTRAKKEPGAHGSARPSCFLSYAWGVDEHERWVERSLARDLRNADIDIVLDRWENAAIGKNVARFISRISRCKKIVVVGTPLYVKKFENRKPSTGTVVAAEVDLINQRLLGTERQKDSVLPILLAGSSARSLPPLVRGRVYADFRDDSLYFCRLLDLILTLHEVPFDDETVRYLRDELATQRALADRPGPPEPPRVSPKGQGVDLTLT